MRWPPLIVPLQAGRPPTYAREWLNATRLSSPTCYLAKSASGLPSSKTPIYFTLAHTDMDPSPVVYIVPKMVRGNCVEPWRPLGPGAPRDNAFAPLKWVLPARPCANGLYGRAMMCARDARAQDVAHFANVNASAWVPQRASLPVHLVNFTQWLVDEYCRPLVAQVQA